MALPLVSLPHGHLHVDVSATWASACMVHGKLLVLHAKCTTPARSNRQHSPNPLFPADPSRLTMSKRGRGGEE